MKTFYIYYSFSEHREDGVFRNVVDEDMHKYYQSNDYKSGENMFLCEIELPTVNREEVVKAGCASFDTKIAELQMQITQQKNKKQQLLAITHQEES